ncbi:MAG TPA: glycosyl hydrolase family 18 protein [Lachnospiraceae bacterium]|nr:glycosyl hydrolase family 18 protein [Lachnospiraceae bacterium]
MKRAIPIIIAIVLILIIGGVTFGFQIIEKYSYSHEQADLYEYFHIIDEEDVPIVLQNEMIELKALKVDGVCYFDLATVHTYFNDRFYVDHVEQLLLYTTPTEMIRTAIGSGEYQVNQEEKDAGYKISFSRINGDDTIYYVAADFVKQYTNFSYEVFDNPNHMQVYTSWEEQQVADISKDTAVRLLGGVKSAVLKNVVASEKVFILEKMDTWCKVKTEDAFIGYVENKFLQNERTESLTPVTDYVLPEYVSLTKDEKICLGWHAVFSQAGNDTFGAVTASTNGLTIIAPTWFSLMDNSGNLQSFASSSYVEKAHKMGLEVWGVVDDFNYKNNTQSDIDLYTVISATTTRTALIDHIMQSAESCGMDGVNIDFENVGVDAGEHFVQFLRELSIRCRKEGLILSVDNYVPYHYNAYYDLEEQGVVCDYIIIMGYDEHWAGCTEAGSVASIGYVRYGMEKTCEYVPSNKVVNALPFYTRLWKTVGTEVTSEAYPMTSVDSVLATYGMEKIWNDEASQNYAEVTSGDTYYQMWVEDTESIGVKLNVMQKYELGGMAAWRLGYEPEAVWELISAYLVQ